MKKLIIASLITMLLAATGSAQTAAKPDDNPSYKIGALIFGDYTYNQSPTVKDADGNSVHNSSFNITRAYINLFANLNHWISFRITPDIARETGSGSSLTGSQDYRLKFAFAQFALDDWTTKGSWVRFGLQQTPWIDYEETIYRYRFQGPTFTDREGYQFASDNGVSGRYVFPGNYGDVHAGYYNGEGWAHAETNNEKAFMVRASLRPMPQDALMKGLRVAALVDEDHYVQGAPRTRTIEQISFEHPKVNAGLDLLQAKDRTSSTKAEADARGWSAFVNPRLTPTWELLFRHDDMKPNRHASDLTRKRDIAGLAYWFPNLNKVSAALMVDYDKYRVTNAPNDTRYGVKMLINF